MNDADSGPVIRTYIDSSILIAVIRGPVQYSENALNVLRSPNRSYVISDIVRLEVLPKAIFHRRELEEQFYERFVASVIEEIATTPELVSAAFQRAA